MKIKPKMLNKGDTIGIISPAGSLSDDNRLQNAVNYFEQKGYKIKVAPHIKDKRAYLAGDDADRLNDLETFFRDDEVSAIMCSRGGYGTFRLLDSINWDIVKNNPKIFVGYSDITALLCNFTEKSGLITFHGPLFASDFGGEVIDKYTEDNFWKILTNEVTSPYSMPNEYSYHCIKEGEAEGELIGGNLAVICGLTGTPYLPGFSGKILFLEDISEPLYKIDRMLMQLKHSGILKDIAGLLFTEFTNIEESEEEIINLIAELTGDFNIPIGYGFPAGHGNKKATIPLGVRYLFNSKKFKLEAKEDFLE